MPLLAISWLKVIKITNMFHCKWKKTCFLLASLIVTLCISILLYIRILQLHGTSNSSEKNNGNSKLCIIVPYRNRFEELLLFAPHLHSFLSQQNIMHHIFIINQVDGFRFNRGSLINIGFIYATNFSNCDYIAMHDVDLLPLTQELSYAYRSDGCYHISAPHLHPRYHYPNFIGGILIITSNDFIRVNGMSNKYWGWGLEDDEFYVRLKEAAITVHRPKNLSTGIHNTFRHVHSTKRKRDMEKCYNQKIITRKRDRQTGLSNIDYSVQSVHLLAIDNASLTVVNVKLVCNREFTPWCICDDKNSNNKSNS